MQTLEGLKKRIKTTASLKDIVSSMKTLSAVSVGQYEKSTKALKKYSESIEMALLALIHGRSIPHTIPQKLKEKIVVVVLGSNQGLVGKFNKSITNFTMESLKQNGIDIKDVDFKNNGILICRKGGYEAVVYFGEEVEKALQDYLHIHAIS